MTQLEPALAEQMKSLRRALGLTQQEAARSSGIAYGTYVAAELYGRMGLRVRPKVIHWLAHAGSRKETGRAREKT